MTTGYVNPNELANVNPERIDMGVDYAGKGRLVAIGRAIITDVSPGGWGSYGNDIGYKLLDGPLKGRTIYYAEGVTPIPALRKGSIVNAGEPIATLIPGWHSGIEEGFGSGPPSATYANTSGGGYSEGQRTAAGQAYSNLVASLGGQPGKAEGRPITGTYGGKTPPGSAATSGGATAAGGAGGGGGLNIPGVSWIGDVANFISDPVPVLLKIALVLGGSFALYKGVTQALGADQPQPRTKTRVIPV